MSPSPHNQQAAEADPEPRQSGPRVPVSKAHLRNRAGETRGLPFSVGTEIEITEASTLQVSVSQLFMHKTARIFPRKRVTNSTELPG